MSNNVTDGQTFAKEEWGRERIAVTGGRQKLGRATVVVLRAGCHGVVVLDEAGPDGSALSELDVTDYGQGIDALAGIAVDLNATLENIGARRLQTVMERVLDEISYEAPDRPGSETVVDAAYVEKHVGGLAKNTDLSRFIL